MPKSARKTANVKIEAVDCSAPIGKDIAGEHWRFCPRCGHELINEKCKLRCPRCHYFMSCSDFDFAG
jgi:DNA-directed RNA polymerase subunit RPC12/RpoP